jgi:2-polyprenyl-3-methyl-5-hydroxy-6-metoxy-1,4-benzoquinol methylase
MTTEGFDEKKCSAFLTKVFEHNAAAMTVFMCSLGDRLGLFKTLATAGPATSTELAERADIHERYAREWLAGMHSSGYLECDPDEGRYTLPREYRPILAKEGHPFFLGSFHEHISGLYPAFEQVLQAFQTGEGVAQTHYSEHFSNGLERATRIWVEHFLVQHWLGAIPGLQAKLEQGADVAEVGCGSGLAVIKLAQTYPNSRFVGYEMDPGCIERATARAKSAGVSEQIVFERLDVTGPLPKKFDFIACFDVLHDVPRPDKALASIRKALRPDGALLVGEWAVEQDPEEDANPLASTMYGFSIMYCVPTTIAQGSASQAGEVLGTLGLPESKLNDLAQTAGFKEVRTVQSGHPILSLYVLTP